jgi:hypothetical protein
MRGRGLGQVAETHGAAGVLCQLQGVARLSFGNGGIAPWAMVPARTKAHATTQVAATV